LGVSDYAKEILQWDKTPNVGNEFYKLTLTGCAMLEVATKKDTQIWLDSEYWKKFRRKARENTPCSNETENFGLIKASSY